MNSNGKKDVIQGRDGAAEVPQWWSEVPAGEKVLIHALVRMVRSAKQSEKREVARAAAQWERGLGFFIKVRLMHRRRRRRWAGMQKAE